MRKRLFGLVLAVAMAVGILGVGEAGATPSNPGNNTSCSAGTDHCSGWLPSSHIPCVVYNVLWDHDWVNPNAPGGEANWIITIQQWWACGDQGGVHLIGNVAGPFPVLDTVIPHNWVTQGVQVGKVEFMPGFYSALLGRTGNVVQWSLCRPGVGQPNGTSNNTWITAANQPMAQFGSGTGLLYSNCNSWDLSGYQRQVTAFSYNASFVRWDHYNVQSSDGNLHAAWQLTLY